MAIKENTITTEEYGTLVSKFLAEIDYEMPTLEYNFEPEQRVMQYIKDQPWSESIKEESFKIAGWGANVCRVLYPYMDRDARGQICICLIYAFLADDSMEELGEAMKSFEMRLVSGQKQEHPVLESLIGFLKDNHQYFGPYTCAMATKGFIEAFQAVVLEEKLNGKSKVPKGATKFPAYLRQKAGWLEPIAHFAFPEKLFPESEYLVTYLPIIQDLAEFKGYVNDILSFYKECIVGDEEFIYINNVADARGISLKEAFEITCADVVQNVKNINEVLEGHGELLKIAKTHMQNYVAFQLNAARYKLSAVPIFNKNGEKIQLNCC